MACLCRGVWAWTGFHLHSRSSERLDAYPSYHVDRVEGRKHGVLVYLETLLIRRLIEMIYNDWSKRRKGCFALPEGNDRVNNVQGNSLGKGAVIAMPTLTRETLQRQRRKRKGKQTLSQHP